MSLSFFLPYKNKEAQNEKRSSGNVDEKFSINNRNKFKPFLKILEGYFDHSSFLFPPKKRGKRKDNEVAKIVIKSHTFLFHQYFFDSFSYYYN